MHLIRFIILLTITWLIRYSSHGQSSGDSSAVHHVGFTVRADTCPQGRITLDSVGEPLDGWLISQKRKHIWVTHYDAGLEDGFWRLHYEKKKGRFLLKEAGVNTGNLRRETLRYDWTMQFIDSNTWRYGLSHKTINWPFLETGDTNHWRRDEFYVSDSLLVLDDYRDTSTYKVVSYDSHTYAPSWDHTIQERFPLYLNQNLNPFTKLRHDGYYRWQINSSDPDLQFTWMLRFYSNGEVRLKALEGVEYRFEDWENVDYTAQFTLDGNTAEFNLMLGETLIRLWDCRFDNTGFMTMIRVGSDANRKISFHFINDEARWYKLSRPVHRYFEY